MTGLDQIPLELISSAIEDNAYLTLHGISGKGCPKTLQSFVVLSY
jgi:hypothetical protein